MPDKRKMTRSVRGDFCFQFCARPLPTTECYNQEKQRRGHAPWALFETRHHQLQTETRNELLSLFKRSVTVSFIQGGSLSPLRPDYPLETRLKVSPRGQGQLTPRTRPPASMCSLSVHSPMQQTPTERPPLPGILGLGHGSSNPQGLEGNRRSPKS